MFVMRPVRKYRWRLSSRNSVSPPSAAAIADSVIGNGASALTAPITSALDTTSSCPPGALSSTFTVPLRIIDDSIRAPFISSKASSPRVSRFATHWIVPVESRKTMNRILLEPRVLLIQPMSSTSPPSWFPA